MADSGNEARDAVGTAIQAVAGPDRIVTRWTALGETMNSDGDLERFQIYGEGTPTWAADGLCWDALKEGSPVPGA